jgi:hypothetical protein
MRTRSIQPADIGELDMAMAPDRAKRMAMALRLLRSVSDKADVEAQIHAREAALSRFDLPRNVSVPAKRFNFTSELIGDIEKWAWGSMKIQESRRFKLRMEAADGFDWSYMLLGVPLEELPERPDFWRLVYLFGSRNTPHFNGANYEDLLRDTEPRVAEFTQDIDSLAVSLRALPYSRNLELRNKDQSLQIVLDIARWLRNFLPHLRKARETVRVLIPQTDPTEIQWQGILLRYIPWLLGIQSEMRFLVVGERFQQNRTWDAHSAGYPASAMVLSGNIQKYFMNLIHEEPPNYVYFTSKPKPVDVLWMKVHLDVPFGGTGAALK